LTWSGPRKIGGNRGKTRKGELGKGMGTERKRRKRRSEECELEKKFFI